MRIYHLICVVCIGSFCFCNLLQAHAVKIFAYSEGRQIAGYGYFSGAGRTKKADVVLMDAQGDEIARNLVNDQGEFSFEIPAYQSYRLRLDAGGGHVTFFQMTESDLDESQFLSLKPKGAATIGEVTEQKVTPGQIDDTKLLSVAHKSDTVVVCTKEIDQIVGRHIRALREQVEISDQKRRYNDILGSIGYIVGIMGLIAFWQLYRKTKKD